MCGASGKVDVKCTRCEAGKVKCNHCHGSGRTEDLLKSVYFFVKIIPRYKPCSICDGTGRKNCNACHGTRTTKGVCPRCGGSGRKAICAKCNGRKSVTCPNCKGAGRFEGQWVKSLQSWPVKRLRFEIEKRQREISNLQGKVSNAEQELQRSSESYERAYANRQPDFDASGYNRYDFGLQSEILSAENQIQALQEELDAIERVLNRKWK
jgi:hypothetical protein